MLVRVNWDSLFASLGLGGLLGRDSSPSSSLSTLNTTFFLVLLNNKEDDEEEDDDWDPAGGRGPREPGFTPRAAQNAGFSPSWSFIVACFKPFFDFSRSFFKSFKVVFASSSLPISTLLTLLLVLGGRLGCQA